MYEVGKPINLYVEFSELNYAKFIELLDDLHKIDTEYKVYCYNLPSTLEEHSENKLIIDYKDGWWYNEKLMEYLKGKGRENLLQIVKVITDYPNHPDVISFIDNLKEHKLL